MTKKKARTFQNIAKGGKAHAVACINACVGLNPEGIPELIKTCEALLHMHKVLAQPLQDINPTWAAARDAFKKVKQG